MARSGKRLDQGRTHREHAADFLGRFYYNKDPKPPALTNSMDRVPYTPLTRFKNNFDLVGALMREIGVLERNVELDPYADRRFGESAKIKPLGRTNPEILLLNDCN